MNPDILLHICNDFAYSKVHKNLYFELDKIGYPQYVFHPLRKTENLKKNVFKFDVSTSRIIYSDLMKTYYRVFFRLKIRKLYNSLIQQIDPSIIRCSYATTLFSDGAISYKLHQEFKIPYILAIRNTDVNLFLKYRPDLIYLGLKILRKASKIIFISEALKDKFFDHPIMKRFADEFQSKTTIINNGIDDFWIENLKLTNSTKSNKFLFVGRFDRNKNVINLISALSILKTRYPDIELGLVGGGGVLDEKVRKLVEENPWINFYGPIYDSEKLLEIFRNHKYFSMISHFETFGLVYLEALSQGLPVVYTKGQGIDGLFKCNVGKNAIPSSVSDIEKSLEYLIKNAGHFELEKIKFQDFRWEEIALRYKQLFDEVDSTPLKLGYSSLV